MREERNNETTRQQNAVLALMYRRAMNEKRISFDDLIGKKREHTNKVVSIEEKRKTLDDLERSIGL